MEEGSSADGAVGSVTQGSGARRLRGQEAQRWTQGLPLVGASPLTTAPETALMGQERLLEPTP